MSNTGVQTHRYALVGDIGGTNARFALVSLDLNQSIELIDLQTVSCDEYSNIDAAILDFLERSSLDRKQIHSASIAVAGAVAADEFNMTNNHWRFSVRAVAEKLSFKRITLLNDFAAIAWSIPSLRTDDWVAIGGGDCLDQEPVAVLGPGTGLGVGGFVSCGAQAIHVLETEGGHASFAPVDEQEIQILQYLQRRYPRVSSERLISGPGLENIYVALAEITGVAAPPRTAPEISRAASVDEDELCISAMQQFCATLGSVAGDLALTYGAKAGVYIAGGIAPRILEFLQASAFRQRFEAKGRFSAYNAAIATRVVTAAQPGLLGAAAHERSLR